MFEATPRFLPIHLCEKPDGLKRREMLMKRSSAEMRTAKRLIRAVAQLHSGEATFNEKMRAVIAIRCEWPDLAILARVKLLERLAAGSQGPQDAQVEEF